MTSTYTIELLGFPDLEAEQAATELSRVFGIPRDKAERLVAKVPVRVRTGTPRPEAERYVKALLTIGADVRVQGSGKERVYRARGEGPETGSWTGPEPAVADGAEARRPAAASPPGLIVCPRCGFEQPESDSCARCGIVYSKFGAPRDGAPTDAVAGAAPALPHLARSDPFVLSVEDDDGLFQSELPAFDPARLMRLDSPGSGLQPALAAGGGTVASGPPALTGTVIRKPTGRAAEFARGSTDVGFWDKVGRAFAFSALGPSYQWLSLMFALGALSWLVLYIPSRVPVIFLAILGYFLAFIFFSAFLSAQWRFFAAAFYMGVSDQDGTQSPLTDLSDFRSEFVLPGYVLSLGAAILWSPFAFTLGKALFEGAAVSPVRLLLFALLPLIYWPMGMAYVSASGRLTEIFIVTGVIRGMVIGGLEYAFVAALGVAVFFLVNYWAGASGEVAFYHWALLYALLGYISSVQGYLLGRLLRRRPKMISGTEVEVE